MWTQGVAQCVREAGVGFMFAPRYHPAMAAVKQVRAALKIRTAFNILVSARSGRGLFREIF